MRVLVICDDRLYPARSGGRAAILGELGGIEAKGGSVIVFAYYRRAEAKFADAFARWPQRYRERARLGLLEASIRRPLSPYQLASRLVDARDVSWLSSFHPDLIISEHEWCLPLSRAVAESTGAPFILRSHNDPIAYARALLRSSSGLRLVYYALELLRVRCSFRRRFYRGVREVWPMTSSDGVFYERLELKVDVVPPVLHQANESVARPSRESRVLAYVGSMDMPHAYSGLRWFIDSVLPELVQEFPDIRLRVAGRRASETQVEYFAANPHVTFLGETDSVEEVLNGASVFINPIFAGSGINMKLGPPSSAGLPIVTTTIGGRGLSSLSGLKIADNAAGQVCAISSLLSDSMEWNRVSETLRLTSRAYSATDFGSFVVRAIRDVEFRNER